MNRRKTVFIRYSINPVFHYSVSKILGDHSEGETPVPIPNTEVKPFNADGTAWVTVRESRTLPRLKFVLAEARIEEPVRNNGLFC